MRLVRQHVDDLFEGAIGTAERVNVVYDSPARLPILAMYLIEITDRNASTFWRYHAIGVLALDKIPNVEKVYPEAEIEIVCFTLVPDQIVPTADNFSLWQVLKPNAVQLQFHGLDVDEAGELAQAIAYACAEGMVPVEPTRFENADQLWRAAVRNVIDQLQAARGKRRR